MNTALKGAHYFAKTAGCTGRQATMFITSQRMNPVRVYHLNGGEGEKMGLHHLGKGIATASLFMWSNS